MNKLEMYNYLKKINIWHEITEHKAVYNMAEYETPYGLCLLLYRGQP